MSLFLFCITASFFALLISISALFLRIQSLNKRCNDLCNALTQKQGSQANEGASLQSKESDSSGH